MKTKKQVLKDNETHAKLIKAVLSGISIDSVQDVNEHGASAGFGSFICYSDTHKFAMKYRKEITALILDQAADMGEEVLKMVENFGVFRKCPMDADDKINFYTYIGGGRPGQCTITNLMAWFALEEVCRMFVE